MVVVAELSRIGDICGKYTILSCLGRLRSFKKATQQRLLLLHRCLENVEDGKSVAPSLRLMQRIIDAQPEISINSWTNAVVGGGARSTGGVGRKDEILEILDKDRSLLKLLVDVSLGLVTSLWPFSREPSYLMGWNLLPSLFVFPV